MVPVRCARSTLANWPRIRVLGMSRRTSPGSKGGTTRAGVTAGAGASAARKCGSVEKSAMKLVIRMRFIRGEICGRRDAVRGLLFDEPLFLGHLAEFPRGGIVLGTPRPDTYVALGAEAFEQLGRT